MCEIHFKLPINSFTGRNGILLRIGSCACRSFFPILHRQNRRYAHPIQNRPQLLPIRPPTPPMAIPAGFPPVTNAPPPPFPWMFRQTTLKCRRPCFWPVLRRLCPCAPKCPLCRRKQRSFRSWSILSFQNSFYRQSKNWKGRCPILAFTDRVSVKEGSFRQLRCLCFYVVFYRSSEKVLDDLFAA